MAHDVFVSHARNDKPIADAVCAMLEQSGIRCWIAPRDIQPGADWGNSIIQALKSSRAVVLVLSGSANSSPHITREVERAVHQGIPVIPLRVEDVLPEGALEYHLGAVHWLDAMTPPLESHLNRLIEIARSIVEQTGRPPATLTSPEAIPVTPESVPSPAESPSVLPAPRRVESATTQAPTEGVDSPDISASSLWNEDLAPTRPEARTWTTFSFAALWIALAINMATYGLASVLVQQGMVWWQALGTILLGHLIVLVPMALNAHAGAKYGVPFAVLCRASFGVRGAHVPAMMRAGLGCFWFGIETWMGGAALNFLLSEASPWWAEMTYAPWVSFAIFWLVAVAVILLRVDGACRLARWSLPLLVAAGASSLWWAVSTSGGLGTAVEMTGIVGALPSPAWTIFPAALAAQFSYWATKSVSIADFSRYANGQRAAILGPALGLPLTTVAYAFIGLIATSSALLFVGIPEQLLVIAHLASPATIAFTVLVLLCAHITTVVPVDVVSAANAFSNLSPRRVGYLAGAMITAIAGIMIMPWKLHSDSGFSVFPWLIGGSNLMGAIAGVLIADYWILRKRELSLAGLFAMQGPYTYSNGINWRAMAALAIAIVPFIPSLVSAARQPFVLDRSPQVSAEVIPYTWPATFAISSVVYLGLMWRRFGRRAASTPDTPRS